MFINNYPQDADLAAQMEKVSHLTGGGLRLNQKEDQSLEQIGFF